jgi:hypothetical protein
VTERMRMEEGWLGHLREAEFVFFDTRLGPDMLADAQRAVPKLTGRLEGSLDFQVVNGEDGLPELQMGSFPDDEGDVEYAPAVELGFHGPEIVREHERNGHVVREYVRQGNTPEQPYLRPALYRERY